jgi:ABC-type uncharacterized transport system substrate-binding protein
MNRYQGRSIRSWGHETNLMTLAPDSMAVAMNRLNRYFGYLLTVLLTFGASWNIVAAENVRRLAFVSQVSPSTVLAGETAFWMRLRELGWVEGSNITVARLFANGKPERLPVLMTEALQGDAEVIVTPGSQGALAAKQATKTVPIVSLMGDPVGSGLVESLSRPGGNLTGLSVQNAEELPAKWIELIRELQPRLSTVALIVNPDNPLSSKMTTQVSRAAASVGIKLVILEARRMEDYQRVFVEARQRARAVIVHPDSIAIYSRQLIASLAIKQRLPVLFGQSDFVEAGGLISYGPDLAAIWRRAADYVDKLLRGANPAELPIEQPVAFYLMVNLKSADAIWAYCPRVDPFAGRQSHSAVMRRYSIRAGDKQLMWKAARRHGED